MTFMAQESLLACFNAVRSWDSVVNTAENIVPFNTVVWEDVRSHECILPLHVRARTKRLLADAVLDKDLESHESLLEFFNESLASSELKMLCEVRQFEFRNFKFFASLELFSVAS